MCEHTCVYFPYCSNLLYKDDLFFSFFFIRHNQKWQSEYSQVLIAHLSSSQLRLITKIRLDQLLPSSVLPVKSLARFQKKKKRGFFGSSRLLSFNSTRLFLPRNVCVTKTASSWQTTPSETSSQLGEHCYCSKSFSIKWKLYLCINHRM